MGDLRVKLKARPEISWEYKQGTRRIRIEIPTNERNFPFSRKFFNEANYAQLFSCRGERGGGSAFEAAPL